MITEHEARRRLQLIRDMKLPARRKARLILSVDRAVGRQLRELEDAERRLARANDTRTLSAMRRMLLGWRRIRIEARTLARSALNEFAGAKLSIS